MFIIPVLSRESYEKRVGHGVGSVSNLAQHKHAYNMISRSQDRVDESKSPVGSIVGHEQ